MTIRFRSSETLTTIPTQNVHNWAKAMTSIYQQESGFVMWEVCKRLVMKQSLFKRSVPVQKSMNKMSMSADQLIVTTHLPLNFRVQIICQDLCSGLAQAAIWHHKTTKSAERLTCRLSQYGTDILENETPKLLHRWNSFKAGQTCFNTAR